MTHELLLEGLNPEQCQVVEFDRGPCLVAACAGAGKTSAVVRRMAYLVKARGVNASRIFGTTFTRKAAQEMNTRIKKLLGDDTFLQIQTFHAFCRRVLGHEIRGFSDWHVDSSDRYRLMLKKAIGFEHMDWSKSDIEDLSEFVELAKASAWHPGSDGAQKLAEDRNNGLAHRNPDLVLQAYELAEKLRLEAHFHTFSDWMVMVHDLFRDHEDARQRWAGLFDYVIIDEAQDNNLVQLTIAEQLARDHRNLMLVGDSRQGIYGWRGAAIEHFLKFPEVWQAPTISMFRNYRSGDKIIDAANKIMAKMKDPSDAMVGERKTDGLVEISMFETAELEASTVAETIRAIQQDGVTLEKTVVLYRVNSKSRAIEEALARNETPYRVLGSSSFYTRKEIATLLSYLRVIWKKGGTMDDVRRSLFSPQRMLGKVFFQYIERAATERPANMAALVERAISMHNKVNRSQRFKAQAWAALIDAMRDHVATGGENARPDNILRHIVNSTDYEEWLKRDEGRESPENDRMQNVNELIASAQKFETVGALLEHVKGQIELFKRSSEDAAGERVTLMTIHRSKGLEYPHVFLVACNDGVLPHFFGDPEEERRLFYVATTRAVDHLHISCVKAGAEEERPTLPSGFLSEIGLEQPDDFERDATEGDA